MDLGSYVEAVERQLLDTAEAGGDDARALAQRLVGPLDAAMRLALQDVLAAAAEEITTELAPGSVELRLRGRNLDLVVTPPRSLDQGPDNGTVRVTSDSWIRWRRGRFPPPKRVTMPPWLASTFACPTASRPASSGPPVPRGSRSIHGWCVRPPPRWNEPARTIGINEPRRVPSASPAGHADHTAPAGSLSPRTMYMNQIIQSTKGPIAMPTFDTPSPIAVDVEIGLGDIQIFATDRTDTVVDIRPSDPAKESDVVAAKKVRVEYSNGRLLIKAARSWKRYAPRGGHESIDVRIDLPAGSDFHGEAGIAGLRCSGPLGECHYKSGLGDIHVEQAGSATLKVGTSDVSIDRVGGKAEITTGSGTISVGRVDGEAVIKNSNGDSWVGEVTGDLRVNAANGKITVDRAKAGVVAKSANGAISVDELAAGTVVLQTGFGQIDLGIRHGVAAWLDLVTSFGKVRNELSAADAPGPEEHTAEVRARTAFGDITVRRPSRHERTGAA